VCVSPIQQTSLTDPTDPGPQTEAAADQLRVEQSLLSPQPHPLLPKLLPPSRLRWSPISQRRSPRAHALSPHTAALTAAAALVAALAVAIASAAASVPAVVTAVVGTSTRILSAPSAALTAAAVFTVANADCGGSPRRSRCRRLRLSRCPLLLPAPQIPR
jgi:hypothetical protein